jgi:hypothetical protein
MYLILLMIIAIKKLLKHNLLLKTKKLDNKYYKSIENIKLLKCELDKCHEGVKYIIHQLSDKINYTKKIFIISKNILIY